MSSNVIPKEQLTAYQRWEMASFGEEPRAQQTAAAAAAAAAAAQQKIAAEAARLREEARQQGYDEGFNQGHAEGLAAGRTESARETLRLRQVAEAFDAELARVNDAVADDMLNLSLDLAKAMLKTALKLKPELVLPVVSEAIRYLPSVQQPAMLVLHPQDAAIVRDHMKDELEKAGWRLGEDMQIERGGCRVETASNQIDATLPVRWQRIADALGKQTDWLE
ncbi:flagellar assembly protein FliH [Noviherbaspirillum denitrificans]|uniref:Flagellar assembly protein FliH n=1 Tax=Noviherbaspirillum denitrificans TaxID=1968433 RepID=A0A254TFA4_9BURK|nr:flagellar assembly protein FliH [Noviherbaspirillum denitrificans]OWW21326.1 flagellar assembly protein FliH [Noviherbaspirillum denitrificans]